MTWARQDPDFQALAERILTPAELAAYRLSLTPGNGYRTVARILGISKSAARDRIDRARDKLARETT